MHCHIPWLSDSVSDSPILNISLLPTKWPPASTPPRKVYRMWQNLQDGRMAPILVTSSLFQPISSMAMPWLRPFLASPSLEGPDHPFALRRENRGRVSLGYYHGFRLRSFIISFYSFTFKAMAVFRCLYTNKRTTSPPSKRHRF